MSLHRRNPRRDANEAPIVKALEQVGAIVKRISAKGVADLLVLYKGRIYLLEVKMPKTGRMTPAQEETTAEGWPVTVVLDAYDALTAIGILQDAERSA